jgi:hypothetical protein
MAWRSTGQVLQDMVLRKDGGIRVTEFASDWLSRVVNGKAVVSAELDHAGDGRVLSA